MVAILSGPRPLPELAQIPYQNSHSGIAAKNLG
jgi:hypothetical protein